jgi:MinD-like ATPase involved in chromosome partitioning or flagellar assembly
MAREQVIAVACGRPGLGASVVAALVALAAMGEGTRVLWIEAHAPEGGPDTLAARVAAAGAHDLVVVDAGSRIDGVDAACALGDCTLLLVLGDARADLAVGYAMAKHAAARPAAPALAAVTNRLDALSARWAAESLADACARFLGRPMLVAGHLADDPTLAAALAAGMPVADAAAGSPVMDAARHALRALRSRRAAALSLRDSSLSASTPLLAGP